MRVVAVCGDLVGYLRTEEPAALPALDAELPMIAIERMCVVWGELVVVEMYGVDNVR
jgi:hypothetical protein